MKVFSLSGILDTLSEHMFLRTIYWYVCRYRRSCYSMETLEYKNIIQKIYSRSKSLLIQSQHWVSESQLSMEGVALDYFNNYYMVRGAD